MAIGKAIICMPAGRLWPASIIAITFAFRLMRSKDNGYSKTPMDVRFRRHLSWPQTLDQGSQRGLVDWRHAIAFLVLRRRQTEPDMGANHLSREADHKTLGCVRRVRRRLRSVGRVKRGRPLRDSIQDHSEEPGGFPFRLWPLSRNTGPVLRRRLFVSD